MKVARFFAVGMLTLLALALPSVSGRAQSTGADAQIAQAATAPPPYSWTGIYLGAAGGVGWTSTNATWTPLPSPRQFGANQITMSLPATGGIFGVLGGYNWQFAPSWVAGAEADWSWADDKKSSTKAWTFFNTSIPVIGASTTMSKQLTWVSSLRGRFGYAAMPRLMPYVTGGFALASINYSANNTNGSTYFTSANTSKVEPGFTVGAGVEWMLSNSWLLRGEYLYDRFYGAASVVSQSTAFPAFPSGYTWSNTTLNLVRIGLAYKF